MPPAPAILPKDMQTLKEVLDFASLEALDKVEGDESLLKPSALTDPVMEQVVIRAAWAASREQKRRDGEQWEREQLEQKRKQREAITASSGEEPMYSQPSTAQGLTEPAEPSSSSDAVAIYRPPEIQDARVVKTQDVRSLFHPDVARWFTDEKLAEMARLGQFFPTVNQMLFAGAEDYIPQARTYMVSPPPKVEFPHSPPLRRHSASETEQGEASVTVQPMEDDASAEQNTGRNFLVRFVQRITGRPE
jgi:hypothetical protein